MTYFYVIRWKYMRTLVADGNFKQDHLAMKNDSDDVALSDGLGFMVSRKLFENYLNSAPKTSKHADSASTVSHNYSIPDTTVAITISILYRHRLAMSIEPSPSKIMFRLILTLLG